MKLLAFEFLSIILGPFDSGLDDMLNVLIFFSESLMLKLLHLDPFLKVFQFFEK